MKAIQSTMAEPVAYNKCENDESDTFNQHKFNDIQDLLRTHNSSVQDER